MTIDERLCKFQGKCWHLWEYDWRGLQICSKCGIDRIYSSIKNNYVNDNLDFSDDHTAMELYRWFSTAKEKMFTDFNNWCAETKPIAFISKVGFFAHTPREGKSYMRWVVLLSEWLSLEETMEKWGWEECQYRKEWPRVTDKRGSVFFCEKECGKEPPPCNGSGKIRAEWAREEG